MQAFGITCGALRACLSNHPGLGAKLLPAVTSISRAIAAAAQQRTMPAPTAGSGASAAECTLGRLGQGGRVVRLRYTAWTHLAQVRCDDDLLLGCEAAAGLLLNLLHRPERSEASRLGQQPRSQPASSTTSSSTPCFPANGSSAPPGIKGQTAVEAAAAAALMQLMKHLLLARLVEDAEGRVSRNDATLVPLIIATLHFLFALAQQQCTPHRQERARGNAGSCSAPLRGRDEGQEQGSSEGAAAAAVAGALHGGAGSGADLLLEAHSFAWSALVLYDRSGAFCIEDDVASASPAALQLQRMHRLAAMLLNHIQGTIRGARAGCRVVGGQDAGCRVVGVQDAGC